MNQTEKSSIIASEDTNLINQMTDILLQHDFTITIEKSIMKIISKLLESNVNLLILDLDSPQSINFESIDIIRKLRPRLPIIVLSTDSSLETLKALAQKGIFYSTTKPIEAEEIQEVLEALELFHRKHEKYSNCTL